ncbi:CBS domain-containing protein [Geminicoccus harenae]|uniref:CBS domain-containing protein n=1 Tax=Geminicoccus harenae TaxID=2498453 RepID=UPI00168B7249|nr:CBS domain-containing protein [Geminicoccus harenae]
MNVDSILAGKGREVRTIRPAATVADAIQRMHKERVGALVVSEDGRRIDGIISDRGIMDAIAVRGLSVVEVAITEVMAKEVFTCVPQDEVSSIMAVMTNRRIRHLPVVDEQGRLAGIISIGDVVKHRIDEIQFEAEAMREYIVGGR